MVKYLLFLKNVLPLLPITCVSKKNVKNYKSVKYCLLWKRSI